jgi:tetratricopeptide (TPR) repeat protein
MKICPLVTQTCVLEERDVLVRELDDVEPAREQTTPEAAEDPLFINPESKSTIESPPAGDAARETAVRFVAKTYHGRVECLGELCRFHDDGANVCRIERLLSRPAADADALGELRGALDRSASSREESAETIRALLAEFEAKHSSRAEELSKGFERGFEELREIVRAAAGERDSAIDALSLTLDARSEEIERKIESSAEHLAAFRGEIASWKEALSTNVAGLDTGLAENRRLVDELSRSHEGIMQLVENQKRSIEEEGRKRRTAEARRHNNAGVLAYHNGQYEKALELFRTAVEIEPSMTEAYNNLGLAYTEMNEPKRATEAFRKAIEIQPELAAAYNNLGYVFYRLGSYTEAIEMYNEAIGRNADNASAYTNLGNAYYKMKRIEDAIGAWKRALEIDPANEKAKRNLKRFHAEVK